jgi:hypothetical protein
MRKADDRTVGWQHFNYGFGRGPNYKKNHREVSAVEARLKRAE